MSTDTQVISATPDYRYLGPSDFRELFDRVAHVIFYRFGVDVREGNLRVNITGDFDGISIVLRKDMDEEMKLFILLHLFGHTVQFNISDEMRKIGLARYGPDNLNTEALQTITNYEQDSSRYGLWLLHQIGITHLDQWVSDWSNGDLHYLLELYTTGKKYDLTLEFLTIYKQQYIKFGSKLITPLLVPVFTPTQWESRFSF